MEIIYSTNYFLYPYSEYNFPTGDCDALKDHLQVASRQIMFANFKWNNYIISFQKKEQVFSYFLFYSIFYLKRHMCTYV